VTLTFDDVERVVPEGVQLQTGEVIPLDVLIFATGFSLVCLLPFDMRADFTDSLSRQLPPRLEVIGVGGVRLDDYWKSKGGPEAYYGLAVPNFPNYFMLLGTFRRAWHNVYPLTWVLGPNSAGGHASVIFIEEVQVRVTTAICDL
jgi:cation diffusion facilitator CzcD-associated flavoprotein CzcO